MPHSSRSSCGDPDCLDVSALHSRGQYRASGSLPSLGEDDKSLAVVSGCSVASSGDKHLPRAARYGGVKLLKPRVFRQLYLEK